MAAKKEGKNKQEDAINPLTVLKPLPDDPNLTWASYFAPDQLKEELQHIAETMDPAFQKRLQAIHQHCRERPDAIYRGRPMLLLHGPPGTGKTHAMRMLASLCGLTAFTLDLKIMAESWEPRVLFNEVLAKISKLSRAIVFLDECEGIFRSRGPMMNYASVSVTAKVDVIDDFLAWVDGLETARGKQMPQVLLCLSTNMLEHLDPAIISRSTCLAIDLPALPERNAWWRAHAKHLAAPEQLQLAETTEGLSFRDLSQVAERVERAAARKEESLKHCTVCKYHDVASQILKRCPAAREAVCAKSPAHEVEKLREQLRSEKEKKDCLEKRLEALEEAMENFQLPEERYCLVEAAPRYNGQMKSSIASTLKEARFPDIPKAVRSFVNHFPPVA